MPAKAPYSPITALNAALFRLFKRFYFLEFGEEGARCKKIMILDIPLPELLQSIKICCCFAPILKRKKILEFWDGHDYLVW